MDKPIRILMTALLVLLVAGSAMCDDGPYVDEVWTYDIGDNDQCCFAAGDEVIIRAMVCDGSGHPDLANMIVTADMSVFGGNPSVSLTYEDTIDEYCAMYIGSTMVTTATCEGCNGGYYASVSGEGTNELTLTGVETTYCSELCITEFPVTATDPTEQNHTGYGAADVEAGPCMDITFMGIEPFGDYDPFNPPEPMDEALTQLWFCIHPGADPGADWFLDYFFNYKIYVVPLMVYSYDEYGNFIGPAVYDCCDYITITADSPATLAYAEGMVLVYNEQHPADVTVRAHCINGEGGDAEHDISFLEPIGSLNLTTDVDAAYGHDGCSEGDCYTVAAQLLDDNGDPIPMPNVPVVLYVDNEDHGFGYTDDNGTAYIEVCDGYEIGTVLSIRAEAECREGTMTLDVVDPVLGSIVISPAPDIWCYTDDDVGFHADCYSDHEGPMCCPNLTWSSTNEYVATIDNHEEIPECAVMWTHHSGITHVTAGAEGIYSDPTKVIVSCYVPEECDDDNVTLVADDVTFSVNFSDGGCAYLEAVGDPLMYYGCECCDESDMVIVKGAYVDTDSGDPENDTYTLTICYNATTLELMGIEPGTLTILKCNETDWDNCTWEDVGGTDNGSCVTVELEHLCLFALAGEAEEDDPCAGVTCDDICVEYDLWSQVCEDGECVPDEMIEENCTECGYETCDGVECNDTVCVGYDLYTEVCDNGECVPGELIEEDCAECGFVCDCGDESEICYGVDLWCVYCYDNQWEQCELIEANSYSCGYRSSSHSSSGSSGGGIYPPGWNTPTNATDADTDADGGNGTYPDEPESADDSPDGGVIDWDDGLRSDGTYEPLGDEGETGETMAPIGVPDPTVPGFAGLIGIVAFVVIALLVKRRRT